jgi:curli biogenesis system outer membrane secretion channel CsgG
MRIGVNLNTAASLALSAALAFGQAPAKPPAAAKPAPAAAKPAGARVDEVIAAVKAGVGEADIIDDLRSKNAPMTLALTDLTKLKGAGVSDAIIAVMRNPGAAVTAAPAAAAPAPVAAAPAPEPVPVQQVVNNPVPNGPPTQAQKKRVIVDEFDYSAVMTAVQSVFGTQQNIGKGIRAMLTKRVAEQQKLVVVERAKINSLMAEQDRNASNRVKQGSGARIGQISGADAVLAGDIIIFGRDDKKTSVKGGGIIGAGLGAIAASKNEDKAVVAITYRLIDAETSEIIATGEARGESSRKSKGLAAIGGALGKGVAGVEVDMTSSNFAQTIIGEATQDCVNKLADILTSQTDGMKKSVRPVEGRVALASAGQVTLNVGANDGVNQGEVFEISRIISEVRDPVTKEVLDLQVNKIGEVVINSVRDKISSGTYSGGAAKAGDVARKKLQ